MDGGDHIDQCFATGTVTGGDKSSVGGLAARLSIYQQLVCDGRARWNGYQVQDRRPGRICKVYFHFVFCRTCRWGKGFGGRRNFLQRR